MIRLADYIVRTLASHGVRDVFLVTGGGAMHLNDAFGRCHDLRYVACHHEQTCAMAAESYFRLTNRLACVNVTTGPGGTNAITGVYGAWVDSCGMIVVSGNVRWETLVRSTDLPLRQLGDQELDITRVVAPITKYAVMVTDPASIRYHLERALHLAASGRPGPVWLDIPMNVQSAMIDETQLRAYDPAEDAPALPPLPAEATLREIVTRLKAARRPVIYAGSGVRLAGAEKEFVALAEKLGVAVCTGFNAHDLLPDAHPLLCGRPGSIGDRAGNFAVQNADFVLILGCRLNIRQISYNWKSFARAAYKVMVDADVAELRKPTLQIDQPVHTDAREFVRGLLALDLGDPVPVHGEYVAWCQTRRQAYPVVLPEYHQSDRVNPYVFVDELFQQLPEDEIVVTGDGTACVATFQAARLKRGQRLYSNSGSAPMGFDVPAAIGAAVAAGRRVIALAGDGSLQMNVQDLMTIATYRLPVKLFVLNNQGYHSIRQTQRNFFPGNDIGCGPESGVEFPDYGLLAAAHRLPYRRIATHAELKEGVRAFLAEDGAGLCEVMLDLNQPFAPKLSSRRLPDGRMVTSPLEDMAPFLDRDELARNLLVPPWDG